MIHECNPISVFDLEWLEENFALPSSKKYLLGVVLLVL
jgi:hypothetical protein